MSYRKQAQDQRAQDFVKKHLGKRELAKALKANKRGDTQLVICLAVQQATQKRMRPTMGLTDQIIAELNDKVQHYGSQTFPLSDKQIAVIDREMQKLWDEMEG